MEYTLKWNSIAPKGGIIMKMTIPKLRKLLEERLQNDDRTFKYNRDDESLRVESNSTEKGITLSLSKILAKWEINKEKAIDEVVYYVEEALQVMGQKHSISGREKNIFPVIRSTSFPTKTSEGVPFIYDEHTAETRIYYALDLGNTYRLIDEAFVEREGWNVEQIREIAKFNVRSLPTNYKKDSVAGNDFYFINSNDGYDASRILNESFLKEMDEMKKGTLAVAVPHQDVLIVADIQNETGYDILAQMTMSFFTNGLVPITALSFLYEKGELEPIFILGKNRPSRKEK